MIKALRKDRYDLFELMLMINKDKILKYEVLCIPDGAGRNVLHHAVIKQHSDIVRKLILLDADSHKLRDQIDTKQKTPEMLDTKKLFKDIFETPWDAARIGNTERLKQLIGISEKDTKPFTAKSETPW